MGTDKVTQHGILSEERNPSLCDQAHQVGDVVHVPAGRNYPSIRGGPCNPCSIT